MSAIPEVQNSPLQLERLAAQRWLYSKAKTVFIWQLVLSGPVAFALAALALKVPDAKPFIGAWALVLTLADIVWLSRWQKRLRETAAKIQEAFDCDVLDLPWHEIKVGKPVDPEVVSAAARRYELVALSNGPLHDWYPVIVGVLSTTSARVVCQRVNCWWDAQQRARYTTIAKIGTTALILGAIALGFVLRITLPDFALCIALPLTPLITIGFRQIYENGEAVDRLQKLKEHAEAMWRKLLAGESVDALRAVSRALQDEIFDTRKRNPPVLNALYERLRAEQELDMNEAARQYVAQVQAAHRDKD